MSRHNRRGETCSTAHRPGNVASSCWTTVSAFDPHQEDWIEYVERLELYFLVFGLTTTPHSQKSKFGWWPNTPPDAEEFRPYVRRKSELSVDEGCMLWGSRVVVPEKGKERVIDMLHEAHPGIWHMTSLARCYVWWPGIDRDLELCVKSCDPCQQSQKSPPITPLHP